MRVTSEGLRRNTFVVGEPLPPGEHPERLALYNEDGTPMDLTKDATRMHWDHEFDLDRDDYAKNDVVFYDDAIWIASGDMPAGSTPGANTTPDTTTTKVGNASFGGTTHNAYLAVPDLPIVDFPGPPPAIAQGLGADATMVKVSAGLGEQITLEWEGARIQLYDGQHGDGLFASGPYSGAIDDSHSPLTFIVDDSQTVGGSGVDQVAVEVENGVTSFTWVVTGEYVFWEKILDSGGGGGGGGGADKPELVDTLPGSPADGDEIYFQNADMAAMGVVWHLRYNSASSSAHKWEFLGGAAMHLFEPTQGSTTSTAYDYVGSQDIEIPLDGDYEFNMSCGLALSDSSNSNYAYGGVGIQGTVDGSLEMKKAGSSTELYGTAHSSVGGRVMDVDAGNLVRPMVKSSGSGGSIAAYLSNAKVSLIPVRVG